MFLNSCYGQRAVGLKEEMIHDGVWINGRKDGAMVINDSG